MTASGWPLVENHLAFFAAHHGAVTRTADSVTMTARAEALSCWLPRTPDARLPPSAHTVRVLPGAGPDWGDRLAAAGLRPDGALLYLTRRPDLPIPGAATRTAVDRVVDAADAEVFAGVQEAGFREPEDDAEAQGWWRRAFTDSARRNRAAPGQALFLARVAGVPAAVALGVHTGGVYGVYAVATLPEFRRRGLATALLERARADAVARGADRLALQVAEGSAAERLYRGLGFTPAFRTPGYTRR
ncbi:MAG TPA: GNAT family N-acetyltransferase [Streptosporangiaceae bacterium]|jgi:GNAT superfamily N-acetyltransferase